MRLDILLNFREWCLQPCPSGRPGKTRGGDGAWDRASAFIVFAQNTAQVPQPEAVKTWEMRTVTLDLYGLEKPPLDKPDYFGWYFHHWIPVIQKFKKDRWSHGNGRIDTIADGWYWVMLGSHEYIFTDNGGGVWVKGYGDTPGSRKVPIYGDLDPVPIHVGHIMYRLKNLPALLAGNVDAFEFYGGHTVDFETAMEVRRLTQGGTLKTVSLLDIRDL